MDTTDRVGVGTAPPATHACTVWDEMKSFDRVFARQAIAATTRPGVPLLGHLYWSQVCQICQAVTSGQLSDAAGMRRISQIVAGEWDAGSDALPRPLPGCPFLR